jgi:hypothetical protein
MTESHGRVATTRATQIFAELARAGQASTPELRAAIGDGASLLRYGEALRYHEAAGRVERKGWTPGSRRVGRAVIWALTEAGRQWLAAHQAALQAVADKQAAAAEAAKERARKASAIATVRRQCSPGCDLPTRRSWERFLADQGCSLAEIGEVFGLSKEMVRRDIAA